MRASPAFLIVCAVLAASGPAAALTDAQSVASVAVNAQVSSRTSLHVSGRLLEFDVVDPDRPASAVIRFAAAARTQAGAEVVLSVEALRSLDGPGGAADVETELSFRGEGEGTAAGSIDPHTPTVAARWAGSGRRQGQLVFSLRAGTPGSYTVPVRFVLSTP